jgi:pimeloyl-ACP methyl ester carboxylesterase
MTAAQSWAEQFVEVAGIRLQLFQGGRGQPLLMFHGPEGNPGWTPYHEALAQHYRVLVPSHPGFNHSPRPSWLETIGHLAHFYHWFVDEQRLESVHLLGFSLGGWLAAEMALMCPHRLGKLVLVGAAGIKPSQGDILDIFLHSPEQVAQLAFYDPAYASEYQQLSGDPATPEVAQQNREMAVRLCWKPYMHNPSLPALLPRLRLPTLIVWGREDRVMPLNCGELYRQAIPGSVLQVIERCGHFPQLEQPQEFLKVVLEFLAA